MQKSLAPNRPATRWTASARTAEASEDGPLVLARAVLSTARRYSRPLGAWVLACLAISALYAHTIQPSYTTSALLLLEPGRSPAALERSGAAEVPALDIYRAESEIEVIKSERLLAYVFDNLGRRDGTGTAILQSQLVQGEGGGGLKSALGLGGGSAPTQEQLRQYAFADFVRRIEVRRVGQSYVVDVSFTSPDPTLSRQVTNAIVSAYLWQSVVMKSEAARSGAEFLQGRVNALTDQFTAAASAVEAGTLPERPMPDADARVIGAALQPLAPSAPRTKLIIAFGGVLGLLSGLFAVVGAYVIDRRVYTSHDVARATGLPVLATVPIALSGGRLFESRRPGKGAEPLPDPGIDPAIRDLRTAIGIVCPSNQFASGRVIAIVGWTAEVGSGLLARRLATILGEGGTAAILIDGNLHGTTGHGDTTADREGLSSLADALRLGARPSDVRFGLQDGTKVLPARSADAQTNDLADLGSRKMAELLDHARKEGTVVLDLPPLATSIDAKALAIAADAVILVAKARQTTIEDLGAAVATLQDLGAHAVGTVLTGARPDGPVGSTAGDPGPVGSRYLAGFDRVSGRVRGALAKRVGPQRLG